MPKVASKPPVYRWQITRIKSTPASALGTVEAPDAETAIKIAIEQFNITDPDQQQRVAAYRVG
jgi:hypothetical protein